MPLVFNSATNGVQNSVFDRARNKSKAASEQKRKPNDRYKQFQRFRVVVAIASVAYCGLVWFEYDDVFKSVTTLMPEGYSFDSPMRAVSQVDHYISSSEDVVSSESASDEEYGARRKFPLPSHYHDLKGSRKGRRGRNRKSSLRHQHNDTSKEDPNAPKKLREISLYHREVDLGNTFPDPGELTYVSKTIMDQANRITELEYHKILDESSQRDWSHDQSMLNHIHKWEYTEDFLTHCVDIKPWQGGQYQTCNSFHEIGLFGGSAATFTDLEYEKLGHGSFRNTLSLRNHFPEDSVDPPYYIMKHIHLDIDDEFPIDPLALEMQRVDAAISQRLTSSPYTLDIYGSCGTNGLYEIAENHLQSLGHFRKEGVKRGLEGYPIPDDLKAYYSANVARALVDLQTVDWPNQTIVHGDIKPEQILLVRNKDGKLVGKLGDFNNSILRKWNVTSQKNCPFYHREVPMKWAEGYKPAETSMAVPLEESVDVYGFGAFVFYMISGKVPWYEFPQGHEEAFMRNYSLPKLPTPLQYGNYAFDMHKKKIRKGFTNWGIFHQSTKYDGDPSILKDLIKVVELSMVRIEDRPKIVEVAKILDKY